ncbi:MAG: site-2 protease family protein, partial [Oscillospiraceae bacterium]|nr:site-2 protease family protein [Oscillospiraceae bacterium]
MFIVIAILIFGALIAVHELGHFAAAKKLGVRVNEFNIGMGPKLWKRQRGETLYTIRLLPFGGSCVMEGEDEETYVAEEAGGGDAPEPTAAHQDYAAWRVSGRTHEEYVEKFGEPYSPPGNRPSLAEWKAAGRSLREYADIYGNPYIKSGDRRKSQMSSP